MTFFGEIDARQYAALRIAFGALAAASLIGLFGESTFYYSDEGWLPVRSAAAMSDGLEWSLLSTITSPVGVKCFLGLTLLSALAMTAGLFTRAAAWATFVGVVSIQVRDRFVSGGGDTVLRVMLFYLALSACGRTWSVDSLRHRYRGRAPARDPEQTDRRAFRRPSARRLASVVPLRLIQIQVCLIYLTSGMAKLHGVEWFNGDALRIVLTEGVLAKYNFDWISTSTLATLACRWLTWLTLAWEIAFPVLMYLPWTRWVALVIGVGLHGSLSLVMSIPMFCWLMIASYLAFLPNTAFRRVEVLVRRWLRRTALRFLPKDRNRVSPP